MDQFANSSNVELLIEKVKKYRAIYDSSDKNHSNRCFIASVWRRIGEDLGIADERAKKKWHQLRCNYMRVKRLEKNKLPGSSTRIKWPFYQSMSFLDQFSEPRDTPNYPQVELPASPLFSCDHVKSESEEPFEESEPDYASQLTPEEPEGVRNRKDSTVEDDFNFGHELRQTNKNSQDENDPDKMFLLSLLPYLKNLTPADNLDFKLISLQFLKSKLNLTSSGSSQHPQPQFHWSDPDLNSSVSTSYINEAPPIKLRNISK